MKTSTKLGIPLAIAAAGGADSALAADDLFLDLTLANIAGESQDSEYKDAIDVLAWSWNLSRDVTRFSGQPANLGPPVVRDIKISKFTDSATVDLASHLIKGVKIPEALLIVRKAGASPVSYVKIKMSDVYVTKIAQGSDAADDRATETIGLNFGNVCITYTPLQPNGSPGAEEEECWDVSGGGKI